MITRSELCQAYRIGGPLVAAAAVAFGIQWIRHAFRPTTDNAVWRIRAAKAVEERNQDGKSQDKMGVESVLVVVFGWGGARRKQLDHLLKAYSEAGLETVAHTASLQDWMDGFVKYDDLRKISDSIDLAVQEMAVKNGRPPCVFFHAHSNNGITSMGALFAAARGRDGKPGSSETPIEKSLDTQWRGCVKGVIIDSAPFLNPLIKDKTFLLKHSDTPVLGSIIGAMSLSYPLVGVLTGGSRYTHPVYSPAIAFTLACYNTFPRHLVRWYHGSLKGGVLPLKTATRHNLQHPPEIPMLLLYGTSDTLIRPTYVESYKSHQESRGVEIDSMVFDSAHVSHFRKHTELYMSTALSFVKRNASKL